MGGGERPLSIPCPADHCDRQMPGTSQICGACAAQLGRALADVPFLAAQLGVTLARQSSKASGGRSATVPLPYDQRAAEAAWVLRSALTGWVRLLADDDRPADDLASMARWLTQRHHALTRHPAADEAHGEITSAVRQAERAIDRRAERWYAGRCGDCDTDLYARPGAAMVRCAACPAEYDVDDRRQELLAAAEDTLAGAALIAQALTSLGQPVTPERLRQWAHRGRIVAHGADQRGRALYRVGDVIEVLAGVGRERMSA
jgi:LSD1 subclass zinc finger protein